MYMYLGIGMCSYAKQNRVRFVGPIIKDCEVPLLLDQTQTNPFFGWIRSIDWSGLCMCEFRLRWIPVLWRHDEKVYMRYPTKYWVWEKFWSMMSTISHILYFPLSELDKAGQLNTIPIKDSNCLHHALLAIFTIEVILSVILVLDC